MPVAAMSASDVLAVVAATLVTVLVAVLGVMLVSVARTLRDLRTTVDLLRDEAVGLLDETRVTVHEAAGELDRVERLITAGERLDDTKRAIATPMVKAMALGTGVSRAAHRLREGEQPRKGRRRNRAS